MAGLANPDADMGALIGNVVESAQTAFKNLLPAAETALAGVGQLISGLAPVIAEALPTLVTDVVPPLVQAAFSLVTTVAETILENAPIILQSGIDTVLSLAQGLTETLPELIPTAVEAVITIVETLIDNVDKLIDAAIAIIVALAEGLINSLPELIAKAPEIVAKLVSAIVENAPQLLTAALELIVTLATGIIDNLPEMAKAAGRIILTVLDGLNSLMSSFLSIGTNIVHGIWNGISDGFSWITGKIRGWVGDVLSFFKNLLGISSPSKVFAEMGGFMAEGVGVGIENGIGDVEKAVGDMSDAAIGAWKADSLTTAISGAGAYQFGAASGGYGARSNTVTVNVYGAEGQSAEDIARRVVRIITHEVETREAAWA